MKKINIGFDATQKAEVIKQYLEENPGITNIVYFYPTEITPLDLSFTGLDIWDVPWSEIIMYRTYYPLLESIDKSYLLIFDEMLRVKKRTDLTYNCCHNYGKQTNHLLTFSFLPAIDDKEDFMILVDFVHPHMYRGIEYDPSFLEEAEIKAALPTLDEIKINSDDKKDEYEEYKETLFEDASTKNPDIIPRNLHLWCGTNCKKSHIGDDGKYVGRNARLKKKNIFVYNKVEKADEYTIVDFPIRHSTFNAFLLKTGAKKLHFLNSGLSADEYYFGEYKAWMDMMKEVFYEQK